MGFYGMLRFTLDGSHLSLILPMVPVASVPKWNSRPSSWPGEEVCDGEDGSRGSKPPRSEGRDSKVRGVLHEREYDAFLEFAATALKRL